MAGAIGENNLTLQLLGKCSTNLWPVARVYGQPGRQPQIVAAIEIEIENESKSKSKRIDTKAF